MKVLHIIPTLGAGGAEKLLVDLIQGMKEKKLDVELLILSNKKHFHTKSIEKLNIPIYYGTTKKIYSLSHIRAISRQLKKNYDVIHTHLYPAQLLFTLSCLFKNKKGIYITTEHSTHNRRRNKILFRFLDNMMYKKYDKVIAISDEAKKNLIKDLNLPSNKINVIHNGIDINAYKNAVSIERDKLITDYRSDDFLILMVAGFRRMKDYETVIRVAALLPNNYKFLFVGDGLNRQEMEKYGLEREVLNICFLGNRQDVPNIMKSVDLFVLSSHWEGFGLVVVEAMASGLPVIGTNVDGLSDVINESGILFKSQDEYDLKFWIQKMNENREFREKYIKKGFKRSNLYTIEKTINEYIYLYENTYGILI